MHSWRRTAIWTTGGMIAFAILALLPVFRPATTTAYAVGDLTSLPLAHGFYRPQTDDTGTTYAWTEREASVTFPYTGRLPVVIHVELRSAAVAGGPDAPVHVSVNGTDIAALHPDPHRRDFQSFPIRITPVSGKETTVTFVSTSFVPGSGDRRTLGTMARSVTLERTAARATLTRWSWLYGALPLSVAIAMLVPFARRFVRRNAAVTATRRRILVGYAAVLVSSAGALGMLVAVAILARVGTIDRYRYAFRVEGTLYLAGFLAVLALHLPLGATGAPSMLAVITRTRAIARRIRVLRQLRDAFVLALPAVIGWPLLGTWGTSDVRDKLDWMHNIASFGLVAGFRVSDNDYPPGTYVILAGVTDAVRRFGLDDLFAYKLSLLLFLGLTGVVLYLWTRSSALATALQFALLIESVVLGYNDVYFVPPLLLALWALRARKLILFGLLLASACVIKWQPVVLAPILMLAALHTGGWTTSWPRRVARGACVAAVPILAVLGTRLVFGDAFDHALARGTGDSFLSANALNAWWVVTLLLRWWRPAALMLTDNPYKLYVSLHAPLVMLGAHALFFAAYGSIVARWWRSGRSFTDTLSFTFLAYLAYCMLNLSVHENHLVPAVVLAAVLWARDARFGPLFLGAALVMNLNLLLFYGLDGANLAPIVPVTLAVSAVNLAVFGFLLVRPPLPTQTARRPDPARNARRWRSARSHSPADSGTADMLMTVEHGGMAPEAWKETHR